MIDLGYLVIAIFVGLIVMVLWAMGGRWNGKRDRYHHTPLPGHRQNGADGGDGG